MPGIDIDRRLIADLGRDDATWHEPGLGGLLGQVRANFQAGEDTGAAAAASDISIVVVSTPTASDGSYDHRHVMAAIEAIGIGLRRNARPHVVVVASTVMPGTMEGEIARRLQ